MSDSVDTPKSRAVSLPKSWWGWAALLLPCLVAIGVPAIWKSVPSAPRNTDAVIQLWLWCVLAEHLVSLGLALYLTRYSHGWARFGWTLLVFVLLSVVNGAITFAGCFALAM